MADGCANSIYRVGYSCNPTSGRGYVAHEFVYAGTIDGSLSQCSFHGFSVRLGRLGAIYLIGVDRQQVDKLMDLIQGFCLRCSLLRIRASYIFSFCAFADSDALSLYLSDLVFLGHRNPS